MIIEIVTIEQTIIYSENNIIKKTLKTNDPKKIVERIQKVMEEENGR